MHRRTQRQLPFRWETGLRARGIPEEGEQRYHELLRQLLREIVRKEFQGGITKHEREDPSESS
jgi:hypothetical protein